MRKFQGRHKLIRENILRKKKFGLPLSPTLYGNFSMYLKVSNILHNQYNFLYHQAQGGIKISITYIPGRQYNCCLTYISNFCYNLFFYLLQSHIFSVKRIRFFVYLHSQTAEPHFINNASRDPIPRNEKQQR